MADPAAPTVPAAAEIPAPNLTRPDNLIPLRIIIFPLDGTVRAAYRLGQPVTHFHFAQELDAIRSRSWIMRTPGLTLDHGVVTADNGTPIREFMIAIKPDEAGADRVYPALFKIGAEGLALYTPYLAGDPAIYDSFIEPKLSNNTVALTGTQRQFGVFGMQGVDRYVYLGPPDYVHSRGATYVVPPDMPGWIDQTIEERFNGVLKIYEQHLGQSLPDVPTVLMSYDDTPGESLYRGDVSSGWIMALRFSGHGWQQREPDDTYDLVHLIAHEGFHLWNGLLFGSQQLGEQPWLHEGSAEYAALLALHTLGELPDASFRDDLEGRINSCQTELGTVPLGLATGEQGNAAYDCGVVVQWIVDVSTRQDSKQARDFFSIWHDLFANGATQHNQYSVEEFRQAVPANARPAVSLLLDESGADRWRDLPRRLKAIGIDLTPPGEIETDDAMRYRALLHLLIQACGADHHGFVTEPSFLQLDTGPNCGSLAGDPAIASAEGHSLLHDMPGAFAAMAKKCGSDNPVVLGGEAADRSYEVACPKPFPTAPRYVLGETGLP